MPPSSSCRELRKLAAAWLKHEKTGPTLDATALVHEVYLRLVRPADGDSLRWDGRGHFIAAAAEAVRRILVDCARRKATVKYGGKLRRVEFKERVVADEVRRQNFLSWTKHSASWKVAMLKMYIGGI